jgi:hypothetical protein
MLLPEHPKFPPALKSLHITDANFSMRNMIANIAKDCKRGRYPSFESFRVTAFDKTRLILLSGQGISEYDTVESCFRCMRAAFEGTSVDFRVSHYEPDMIDPYLNDYWESDSDDDGPFP